MAKTTSYHAGRGMHQMTAAQHDEALCNAITTRDPNKLKTAISDAKKWCEENRCSIKRLKNMKQAKRALKQGKDTQLDTSEQRAQEYGSTALAVRKIGIVSHLVGEPNSMFKFGFICSLRGDGKMDHFFFHRQHVEDPQALACIEHGTQVVFTVATNTKPSEENKQKLPIAVGLSLTQSPNQFQGREGVLDKWYSDRSYGFIRTSTSTRTNIIVFCHLSKFQFAPCSESIISEDSKLEVGMVVRFNMCINYHHNPPGAFALDVRVVAKKPRLPHPTNALKSTRRNDPHDDDLRLKNQARMCQQFSEANAQKFNERQRELFKQTQNKKKTHSNTKAERRSPVAARTAYAHTFENWYAGSATDADQQLAIDKQLLEANLKRTGNGTREGS